MMLWLTNMIRFLLFATIFLYESKSKILTIHVVIDSFTPFIFLMVGFIVIGPGLVGLFIPTGMED